MRRASTLACPQCTGIQRESMRNLSRVHQGFVLLAAPHRRVIGPWPTLNVELAVLSGNGGDELRHMDDLYLKHMKEVVGPGQSSTTACRASRRSGPTGTRSGKASPLGTGP